GRIEAALEADRRSRLGRHGAPARRAGAVGRIDLDAVVERQEHALQALPGVFGRARAAEIGAPDRADEEQVAGQREPRRLAARQIGDQQADRVRGVARRVRDLEAHGAEHDLVAVLHLLVLEDHARGPVHQDRRLHRLGQGAIAGDVIGMRVRLEDVADREALLRGEAEVLGNTVAAGVDDERSPGLATADEVREAAGFFVEDLLEYHRGLFYDQAPS